MGSMAEVGVGPSSGHPQKSTLPANLCGCFNTSLSLNCDFSKRVQACIVIGMDLLDLWYRSQESGRLGGKAWRKRGSREGLRQIIGNNYAERNIIQEKSTSLTSVPSSNPICGLLCREQAQTKTWDSRGAHLLFGLSASWLPSPE